jgi:hypothetical protein
MTLSAFCVRPLAVSPPTLPARVRKQKAECRRLKQLLKLCGCLGRSRLQKCEDVLNRGERECLHHAGNHAARRNASRRGWSLRRSV